MLLSRVYPWVWVIGLRTRLRSWSFLQRSAPNPDYSWIMNPNACLQIKLLSSSIPKTTKNEKFSKILIAKFRLFDPNSSNKVLPVSKIHKFASDVNLLMYPTSISSMVKVVPDWWIPIGNFISIWDALDYTYALKFCSGTVLKIPKILSIANWNWFEAGEFLKF